MVRSLDAVTIGEPWRAALGLAWEAHGAGNIGVGAVLTDPAGAIIATGRNRVFDADAPPGRLRSTWLAHAEMDALAQLPHGDYPEHTLWTTLEPCLMCASAVVLSHVGTVRYAAADPLWSGIDHLPGLNAQAARRWPIRCGPLRGPVAAFCGLLPLVWAVRRKADGVVARAYQKHDPALLDLARRLIGEGVLDELRGGSVEEASTRLWDDLCAVAAMAEDPGQPVDAGSASGRSG
jgi:tRNA(adenine34) deaminase